VVAQTIILEKPQEKKLLNYTGKPSVKTRRCRFSRDILARKGQRKIRETRISG